MVIPKSCHSFVCYISNEPNDHSLITISVNLWIFVPSLRVKNVSSITLYIFAHYHLISYFTFALHFQALFCISAFFLYFVTQFSFYFLGISLPLIPFSPSTRSFLYQPYLFIFHFTLSLYFLSPLFRSTIPHYFLSQYFNSH